MNLFAGSGITGFYIGKKFYPVEPVPSADKIEGHGETIRLGDIYFQKSFDEMLGNHESGPYRLDAVSTDPNDPWFRFATIEGPGSLANYKGSGWRREFKLADSEITQKMNSALRFEDFLVRIYVSFNGKYPTRPVFIPACYIAWVGDLMEAFTTYRSQYGFIKKSQILRWNRDCMFRRGNYRTKVEIPEDFPVSLADTRKTKPKLEKA